MRRKALSLRTALEMEADGVLTLYSILPESDDTTVTYDLPFTKWRKNYIEASLLYPKISQTSLLDYLNTKYVIEVKSPFRTSNQDGKIPNMEWVYIYGQMSIDREKLERYNSKGRYVYILTNPEYPNLVKIGKAVNPEHRLKQINGAGVLSEWQLVYALPVEDDYYVESLVHSELQFFRKKSDQGSQREIFEIELDTAIQTIERFGDLYKTGDPIYY